MEQLANRDLPAVRDPADERADMVAEPQPSLLDEAQDDGGGEGLGDAADAERRIRRHPAGVLSDPGETRGGDEAPVALRPLPDRHARIAVAALLDRDGLVERRPLG